jgi:hypothetical protein
LESLPNSGTKEPMVGISVFGTLGSQEFPVSREACKMSTDILHVSNKDA